MEMFVKMNYKYGLSSPCFTEAQRLSGRWRPIGPDGFQQWTPRHLVDVWVRLLSQLCQSPVAGRLPPTLYGLPLSEQKAEPANTATCFIYFSL